MSKLIQIIGCTETCHYKDRCVYHVSSKYKTFRPMIKIAELDDVWLKCLEYEE